MKTPLAGIGGVVSCEPFDGVFYIENDDEPIIVDPKTTTMEELERLVNERFR